MGLAEGKATGGSPLPAYRQRFRSEYHEVDPMGIVYYARYFDWFTRGRIALMHEVGLDYPRLEREGMLLPVLRTECDYRAAVALGEEVELETQLASVSRTRLSFVYRVWKVEESGGSSAWGRRRTDEGPIVAAEGRTDHAFVDEQGRPIDVRKRFPQVWELLAPFDSGR